MQHPIEIRDNEFRCLIADDSEFARKIMVSVIKMAGGCVVAEASNGNEAVDLYSRVRPDIVLLDITMPVQDGVETLRKIVEQDKNAKVIIVSSIGHKEMVWKALCLGAKSFVTKPYSADYAAMMIKAVVDDEKGGIS